MKRAYQVFLCVSFYCINCFAIPADGYRIAVTIKGIHKGDSCFLGGYYGPKQYYRDTAIAQESGVIIFDGEKELPAGIYSVIIPGPRYFEFIVNEQRFSLTTDTANFITNMKVKGSLENELFFEHFRMVAELQKESAELSEKLKESKDNPDSSRKINDRLREIAKGIDGYKEKIIEQYPNTLLAKIFLAMKDPLVPDSPKDSSGKVLDSMFQYKYFRSHYFDNIDFSNDCFLRTPVYHNRLMQYMTKITPQIPDSINNAADIIIEKSKANKELFKYTLHTIINEYERSNIMGMDAVFVHLAEKYYMTNQAWWVDSVQLYKIGDRARTLKPILLGKPAPPLIFVKDRAGKQIPLYSVDAEYLVLIFWDPDCGHCKKEMPKLKKAYDKYRGKGVEVYAMCVELEREKWEKYIDENQYNWINVADFELRDPYRQSYDISSTPKIFLLDKDKKIIAKQVNAEQLDEILAHKFGMKQEAVRKDGDE